MKTLHVLAVKAENIEKTEGVLNKFRIALGDWDRSKKFDVSGKQMVVYTILCDNDTYTSIKNVL